MNSSLHFSADMKRFQTLAFASKAEENVVIVVVLYKRKIHNVVIATVGNKVLIIAIIKHDIHDRYMDTNLYKSLQGCQNIRIPVAHI